MFTSIFLTLQSKNLFAVPESVIRGLIETATETISIFKPVAADRVQIRKSLAMGWNELIKNDEDLQETPSNQKISISDPRLEKLFSILKPGNTKEENINLVKMMDSVQDGFVDPFDWTTRLLDVLRIDFYGENDENIIEVRKSKEGLS